MFKLVVFALIFCFVNEALTYSCYRNSCASTCGCSNYDSCGCGCTSSYTVGPFVSYKDKTPCGCSSCDQPSSCSCTKIMKKDCGCACDCPYIYFPEVEYPLTNVNTMPFYFGTCYTC